MVDAIDAMLGIGTSSEDELRALADNLRERRRAADWLSVTTVPTIRDLAQNRQAEIVAGAERAGALRRATQDREAQNERARLQRALEARRIANAEARLRFDEEKDLADYASGYARDAHQRLMDIRELELENRKVDEGYSARGGSMRPTAWEDYYMKGGAGEPVRIGVNPLGQPVKFGQVVPMSDEEFAEYERAMDPTRVELEVGKILKDEQDAKAIAAHYDQFFDAVSPYAVGGEDPRAWKNVPGAGLLSGKSDAVGHVSRLAEAEREGTAAGEEIFSALKGIMNMTLREGAGLSQTRQEMENLRTELGDRMFVDPEVALSAYRRLYRTYLTDLKAIQRTSPQVLGAYRSRLGEDEAPYYMYDREFPEFLDSGRVSVVEEARAAPRMGRSALSQTMEARRERPEEELTYPPDWTQKEIDQYNAMRNK